MPSTLDTNLQSIALPAPPTLIPVTQLPTLNFAFLVRSHQEMQICRVLCSRGAMKTSFNQCTHKNTVPIALPSLSSNGESNQPSKCCSLSLSLSLRILMYLMYNQSQPIPSAIINLNAYLVSKIF